MLNFEYKLVNGVEDGLEIILMDKYSIQNLDIEDIFTDTQLSKMEVRKQYIYISLQFPEYDKLTRSFSLKEVHCLISESFLLIIDKHNFKHLHQFDNLKNMLVEDGVTPFDMFYEMLDFCLTKIFKVIAKFRLEVMDVEKDIFTEDDHQDLLNEIKIIKRNLVNFNSIIHPLEDLLEELEVKNSSLISIKGRELLDDSLDKVKKMLNNLSNFKEQMDIVTETNDALVTRSTNETIKVLTIVNLLAIIPTAMGSFFGMNVYLGWFAQDSLYPVLVVIVMIFFFTLFAYMFFRKKGLL